MQICSQFVAQYFMPLHIVWSILFHVLTWNSPIANQNLLLIWFWKHNYKKGQKIAFIFKFWLVPYALILEGHKNMIQEIEKYQIVLYVKLIFGSANPTLFWRRDFQVHISILYGLIFVTLNPASIPEYNRGQMWTQHHREPRNICVLFVEMEWART